MAKNDDEGNADARAALDADPGRRHGNVIGYG